MITSIEMETYDAEVDVGIALCEAYAKQATMLLYSDDAYIQEGKIGDFIQKAETTLAPKSNESTIKKIFMFIPRLMMRLVRFIYDKIVGMKLKKMQQNLEAVETNVDELMDALADEYYDWGDDEYPDDNDEDNINEQYTYQEALMATMSDRIGKSNADIDKINQQRDRIRNNAQANTRNKQNTQQAAGGVQKVSKAECIKAAKELIALADKDKKIFTGVAKLMVSFKTTFDASKFKDIEYMVSYVEKFAYDHQSTIEKTAKSIGKAAKNIEDNTLRSMSVEKSKLSEQQLKKYQMDCQTIKQTFMHLGVECYEFDKYFVDVDAMFNELDEAWDKKSFKHAVNAVLIAVRDLAKFAIDCSIHTQKYIKMVQVFMTRIGKISDEALQQMDGGVEYKMTTMQLARTMLKCLKMFGAVMRKFDEHPDVARLLQISFILMKAVKIIL